MRTRHPLRHRLAAGLTAGLATLLLAGCGGDDSDEAAGSSSSAGASSAESSASEQTGPEVAAAAADALEEAGAVRVAGTMGSGTEAQTIDLFLQGEDVTGSITVSGQIVQLLTVGGMSYLQAGADFWTSAGVPADAVGQVADMWVVVPAEEAESFGEITLASLVEELRSPSDGAFDDEVGSDTIDGTDVQVLTQAASTIYVAAEDPMYPLRVEDTGADAGTLDLSEFGETRTLTAPQNPLDLTQLGA